MSVRTIEELHDILSDDLAWRKKELSALKSLIGRSEFGQTKRNALIRSGVAILYAHWEGFVRNAARSYLEYVARMRLEYRALSGNFVGLAVRGLLNDATGSKKAALHNRIVDFFRNEVESRSKLPYRSAVARVGNLTSHRLENISLMLGLDYSIFRTKEKFIDERLVRNRNMIAHGHYLLIDTADYDEMHEVVLALLNTFRNEVANAATLERFRAA